MPIIFNKEKEFLPLVTQAAAKYSIPVALLLGHIKQESGFKPNARLDEKTSEGKVWDTSWGMMQLLVGTAKTLDANTTVEKLLDPVYNIDLGAKYISQNLVRYKGNIQDAIAAYNAGSARKDAQGRYINSKGVPNVQKYVDKVYQNYIDYTKWLDNGENLIDVSIDPWLVGGFTFLLVLTLIGGGIYASKRRKHHRA
jgi:soluble lytic murein transglycosylase-like protein